MNKRLKIFTITALLGVVAAGCTNNTNMNTLDKNLASLETTVNNSVAGYANDFFINEFDGISLGRNANYNVNTNTLTISPNGVDNDMSNSRQILPKNIDTYRKVNTTTTNVPTNTMKNYRTYYITDGSYVSRYSNLRDENVVADKVKNIENLYSIAYDVSIAKTQFNELKNELLAQIDATRENLENYETLDAAQEAALKEYAVTINNIIDTINTSNALYKNNMIITGTQNFLDNQAYRSAQYINMLNCIDTQISALENAIATLTMINNSILNNGTDNVIDNNQTYRTTNNTGTINQKTTNPYNQTANSVTNLNNTTTNKTNSVNNTNTINNQNSSLPNTVNANNNTNNINRSVANNTTNTTTNAYTNQTNTTKNIVPNQTTNNQNNTYTNQTTNTNYGVNNNNNTLYNQTGVTNRNIDTYRNPTFINNVDTYNMPINEVSGKQNVPTNNKTTTMTPPPVRHAQQIPANRNTATQNGEVRNSETRNITNPTNVKPNPPTNINNTNLTHEQVRNNQVDNNRTMQRNESNNATSMQNAMSVGPFDLPVKHVRARNMFNKKCQ